MKTPFKFASKVLLGLLALGLCGPGAAQNGSNVISYQGTMRYQGLLANGAFDLRFRLLNSASGGTPVGNVVELDNLPVRGGQFASRLDFGVNVFDGQALFLELSTRLGTSTGNYTTLAPAQEITAVPFAMLARSVAANGVNGAALLDGTVGSADINSAQVQRRINGSCTASQAVRQVNPDGSVLCETVAGTAGGDITSVTTSTGLSGGAQSGDINLAVNFSQVQARATGSCQPGFQLRGINQDGSLQCEFVRLPPSSLVVSDADLPTVNAYGRSPAVAIAPSGLAQIAHAFERSLYLTTCLDNACTRSLSRRVFQGVSSLDIVSVKMGIGADGIPSIAFTDFNLNGYFLRCLDPDCAAMNPAQNLGTAGILLAMQLTPSNAAVLLFGSNRLTLSRCANAACATNQSTTLVSSLPVRDADMRLITGKLQIVAAVDDLVRYYSCADATCSVVPSATTLFPNTLPIQTVALTETAAGLPQVFFSGVGNGSGAVFCTSLNCASSDPIVPIPRSDVSSGMSAMTDRAGLAVLVSQDRLSGFTATQCATANCSALFTRSLEACDQAHAVMARDGMPTIACNVSDRLKVIKCNSPGCQ
jgi:hypothetical protein